MGFKRRVTINYRTYPSFEATEYSKKRAVEEVKGAVTLLGIFGIPLGFLGAVRLYSLLTVLPSMQAPTLSQILHVFSPTNWVSDIMFLCICGSYYYYLYSLRRAITHKRCMVMCYGESIKKICNKNIWLTIAEYIAYNTLIIPAVLSIGGIVLSIQHTDLLIPLMPISLAILLLAVFMLLLAFWFFKKHKL